MKKNDKFIVTMKGEKILGTKYKQKKKTKDESMIKNLNIFIWIILGTLTLGTFLIKEEYIMSRIRNWINPKISIPILLNLQ